MAIEDSSSFKVHFALSFFAAYVFFAISLQTHIAQLPTISQKAEPVSGSGRQIYSMPNEIILGSSSMARRKILAEMGFEFTIMVADIDEKGIRKEKPEELVLALAEAKADAIISRLLITGQFEEDAHDTLLITADTVVVYEGVIREKPSSKQEAQEFVKGYSGGHAAVVGSVLVTNLKTGKRKGAWERAEVYFHDIPDVVIDNLIEEGITLNVAGGLMLEHPLTLPFVESVVGTTDTVMGLSKDLTEKLIREAL